MLYSIKLSISFIVPYMYIQDILCIRVHIYMFIIPYYEYRLQILKTKNMYR
jgi:hypothetical protein